MKSKKYLSTLFPFMAFITACDQQSQIVRWQIDSDCVCTASVFHFFPAENTPKRHGLRGECEGECSIWYKPIVANATFITDDADEQPIQAEDLIHADEPSAEEPAESVEKINE